jgi:putative membrane protein
MITYNPKDWFTFIFKIHKEDTFKELYKMMAFLAIYCLAIVLIEKELLELPENASVKNITLIHNLLGFVLSMLLVFRTNTAYDRWWEGRKLWGSLTNTSRNLSIKLDAILDKNNEQDRAFFAKSIGLFAHLLKLHLASEDTRKMISANEYKEISISNKTKHTPLACVNTIYERLFRLTRDGKLTESEMRIIDLELRNFMDVSGGCERIKNTPIPFSYSLFIKKFIFFYIMTLPIGYCLSIGYWSIPLVVFVFYIIASLEVIAEEIEDPFNFDSNDIPTDVISENIELLSKQVLVYHESKD